MERCSFRKSELIPRHSSVYSDGPPVSADLTRSERDRRPIERVGRFRFLCLDLLYDLPELLFGAEDEYKREKLRGQTVDYTENAGLVRVEVNESAARPHQEYVSGIGSSIGQVDFSPSEAWSEIYLARCGIRRMKKTGRSLTSTESRVWSAISTTLSSMSELHQWGLIAAKQRGECAYRRIPGVHKMW